MRWSDYAYSAGPTNLYDLPADTFINVNAPPWWLATWFSAPGHLGDRFAVTPMPSHSQCNYPPLAIYAFWLQGAAWHALEKNVVTQSPASAVAAWFQYTGGPITSRVANTVTARAINSALPIMADLLLALGVAGLSRKLAHPQRRHTLTLWAFGLTLLAPAVFIDSAFWSQTDAWIASGLVWCLLLLVAERYGPAGVVYGATLLLKAQAVIFLPVLALVFLSLAVRPTAPGHRGLPCLGRFLLGTVLTVGLLALPFMLAGAGGPEHGWLRWAYRAYVVPITTDFPFTTLKAFNVWWLDFTARGQTYEALSAEARLLGLSKDLIGKMLLSAAILLAGVLCVRRWRWTPPGWPAFAALVLLAAFLFPTRVHERYIYYCIPFLIATALTLPRWLPVLAALLLVSTFELTWYLWYALPDAAPWEPAPTPLVKAWTVCLALLSLAGFAYALAAIGVNGPSNGACGERDQVAP
jgi:hypothetical protein